MTYGIQTVNLANNLLNTIGGTSYVAPGAWAQLHVGDPGAAGTANLSTVTIRRQLSFGPAVSGVLSLSATPVPWSMTASETIVAISVWSASTGGVMLWDVALTSSQAVNNGDVLTLNTCTLTITPLAV
jgi:hypothetical protein